MTQDEINAVKKAAEKMRKQESAQDEIIEMWNSVIKYAPSEVRIAEFANRVAAKEREACAKVCDDEWDGDADTYEYSIAANDCAAAIRARSEDLVAAKEEKKWQDQTAAGADEEVHICFARAIESKLKEVNT